MHIEVRHLAQLLMSASGQLADIDADAQHVRS